MSLEEKIIKKAYHDPEFRERVMPILLRTAQKHGMLYKEGGVLGSLLGAAAKGIGAAAAKGLSKALTKAPQIGKAVGKVLTKAKGPAMKGLKNFAGKAKNYSSKIKSNVKSTLKSKPKAKPKRSIRKNVEKRKRIQEQSKAQPKKQTTKTVDTPESFKEGPKVDKSVVNKVKKKEKPKPTPEQEQKAQGVVDKLKESFKDESGKELPPEKEKSLVRQVGEGVAVGLAQHKLMEFAQEKYQEYQNNRGQGDEEGGGSDASEKKKRLKQRAEKEFKAYEKKHRDTDMTPDDFYKKLVKKEQAAGRMASYRMVYAELEVDELEEMSPEEVEREIDETPTEELVILAKALNNMDLSDAEEDSVATFDFVKRLIAEKLGEEV